MDFEWDENKRLNNIAKHGWDFLRAKELFTGPHVIRPSLYAGEEDRKLATGKIAGRFVTVVFTMRAGRCRPISMRSARNDERRAYQNIYREAD